MTNPVAAELLDRSNRLGADPQNTNYAGGNTSAKGAETDPVTGEPVELLWVKGSGGDLGTLTEAGLAVLRLDRLRALVDVYPGVEREDEMVGAFDYCLHGQGGAAPSIDTAMHGLVDAAARRPPAPRLRHRVRDRGRRRGADQPRSSATASCGCRGDAPASSSGSTSPRSRRRTRRRSAASSAATASPPGAPPARSARRNSLEIIRTAAAYIDEHGQAEPFGAGSRVTSHCRTTSGAPAQPRSPRVRGLASTDRPMVGHFTDGDVVLDFLARAEHPRLAALGTSLPRPLPADEGPSRWCSTCRRPRRSEDVRRPAAASCTWPTATTTRPTTTGTRPPTARRCAAQTRRSCSCPASACSASARTSRPPGWPASSTSTRST